jgi:hypothetical protein
VEVPCAVIYWSSISANVSTWQIPQSWLSSKPLGLALKKYVVMWLEKHCESPAESFGISMFSKLTALISSPESSCPIHDLNRGASVVYFLVNAHKTRFTRLLVAPREFQETDDVFTPPDFAMQIQVVHHPASRS